MNNECGRCMFYDEEKRKCHRNPPTVGDAGWGSWPTVDIHWWCGEFRCAGKEEDTTIEGSILMGHTKYALSNAGFRFVDDVFSLTDRELLNIKFFGRKALRDVRDLQARLNPDH